MAKLDAVIEDIKEVNKSCGAWIYDFYEIEVEDLLNELNKDA